MFTYDASNWDKNVSMRRLLLLFPLIAIASCTTSGTEPTTTVSEATTTVAVTTTTIAVDTWTKVAPPTVTGSTDAVTVNDGGLADGSYWATIGQVSGSGEVVFTVSRAYFGAACEEWASERHMEEGCMNDYAVDDTDTAIVALAPDATGSVQMPAGPGMGYTVDAHILEALVSGSMTSPIAGYEWVPYPFLVNVQDGYVRDAQQIWVP